MNKLELSGEQERVVSRVVRVLFVEVSREKVRGLVRDDDVGSPGESVVKVFQAQTCRVAESQRHAADGLPALVIMWTLTLTPHSCQYT